MQVVCSGTEGIKSDRLPTSSGMLGLLRGACKFKTDVAAHRLHVLMGHGFPISKRYRITRLLYGV
jgi:hypothetical protein